MRDRLVRLTAAAKLVCGQNDIRHAILPSVYWVALCLQWTTKLLLNPVLALYYLYHTTNLHQADGYIIRDLYISLSLSFSGWLIIDSLSLSGNTHATRRMEAKPVMPCHTRRKRKKKPGSQPQEPGCGGFTGRDALLSPEAARPISMSPPASSSSS